jgi:hypothetical protein
VSVLLCNGDASFHDPDKSPTDYGAYVALTDLHGDGIPDLAASGSSVNVLLGNGDGTFGPRTRFTASALGGVAAFHIHGDRLPNLATTGSESVSVLINDGNWLSAPSRASTGTRPALFGEFRYASSLPRPISLEQTTASSAVISAPSHSVALPARPETASPTHEGLDQFFAASSGRIWSTSLSRATLGVLPAEDLGIEPADELGLPA